MSRASRCYLHVVRRVSVPLAFALALVACRTSGSTAPPTQPESAASEALPKTDAKTPSKPDGEPAAKAPKLSTHEYTFAGIRLNEALGDVVKQGPLAQICDVEEFSDDLSLVVYGKDCDEDSFGYGSTIALFVSGQLHDEDRDLPQLIVRAVLWFGDYFDSQSEFPAKAGMSPAQVDRVLGPPTFRCDIGDDDELLHIQFHPEGTYAILRGDKVVGYGAGGNMPSACEDEQWEIMLDIYFELHALMD